MQPDSLMEKGFEISGIVKAYFSEKPEENAEVSFFTHSGDYFGKTVTDSKGRFYLHNGNAPDSTLFFVQTTPEAGNRKLELTLNEEQFPERNISVSVFDESKHEKLLKYTEKAEQKYVYEHGNRIVQLREVTITAQRIQRRNSMYYRYPDFTLTREEIEKFPPSSFLALWMRVLGVSIGAGGKPYITKFGEGSSPRILVDDSEWPSGGSMPDVWDIVEVDVLTTPTSLVGIGGAGAIVIYTKLYEPGAPKYKTNIKNIIPLGFQKPVEFYAPKYDSPNQNLDPDLRTTIHWQPFVMTDENGKATFNFYTADSPTTYSVLIEGVTDDGRIIYKRDRIVVGMEEK